MSCSSRSLFRTASGRVFSCGWGADGQTGLGHYEQTGRVAEVQGDEPAFSLLLMMCIFCMMGFISGDVKGENIVKLATSADCVLALNGKRCMLLWLLHSPTL